MGQTAMGRSKGRSYGLHGRGKLLYETVFAAPIKLQFSSTLSSKFIMAILWGIVTLKPEIFIFFSDSIPSFNSSFGILYAM